MDLFGVGEIELDGSGGQGRERLSAALPRLSEVEDDFAGNVAARRVAEPHTTSAEPRLFGSLRVQFNLHPPICT